MSVPSSPSRRSALAFAAAVTAGAAMAVTPLADAAADTRSTGGGRPTVVLVHGAWADAAGWSTVVGRLQHAGYPVIAPAVPLRGLSSDAAYLAKLLEVTPGPLVLVGHSYGGAVITQAAAGNDRVQALVYVAAFIPDAGESAAALASKFPGSHLSDDPAAPIPTALQPVPYDGGIDLYLKAEKFRDVFLSNRLSTQRAAVLAATQRPASTIALGEPAQAAAWKTVPSYALVARADRTIPPAAERFMAARAAARTVEADAPHAVHLTHPETVVRLICRAAKETS
ncbi:alpha/beta hydrolase [Streptomyces sp. TRM72054]|uniref:alpha/beta fold hydrolase n=1 Tax=Streptomyces sp. TRM72054 TaxID=2870562 RepID=UPI001C8C97C7|nr:alpha/beta hydrolase [Streptomyces sp. TRM72054]MBX9396338.1 alpha/beta hydrolase [Streptomyces sp. TRM72054]